MNRRFLAVMVVFVGFAAVMIAAGVHYSGKFGSISGRIVERGGTPVTGATVTVIGSIAGKGKSGPMRVEKRSISGADGAFRIGNTVSGQFELKVERLGFDPLAMPIELGVAEHKDAGTLEIERAGGGS